LKGLFSQQPARHHQVQALLLLLPLLAFALWQRMQVADENNFESKLLHVFYYFIQQNCVFLNTIIFDTMLACSLHFSQM
jgi:hypothetical protein